jgi:hypothetical protein
MRRTARELLMIRISDDTGRGTNQATLSRHRRGVSVCSCGRNFEPEGSCTVVKRRRVEI